ncbi:conserved protein, unknown function [Plasmodium sp. gorilla clade G1]|uniref:SAYSvFN domain-containing protein n=1 Tax=Plasmodium reichenowi TaxID=5854 RepID=A0A151LK70_PLARE|nr:conserved protein, unknown function [Plasmodium reichenowi]KYN99341.1 conserved protein, unknown function [Plasmodium reichenowi]SOS78151.1 conserved protein, unknown function [Plasmodium sp. gorilla clade G1]
MSKKKKNSKNKNINKYFNPKIVTAILLCSCYFLYNTFGSVYIIIVLIAIIFLNLENNNDSSISAYSIFNKGKRYLIGDLRMNQIENELRNTKYKNNDSEDNFLRYDDIDKNKFYIKGSSKYNNKLCTCGSKKKFKKCCGIIKNNSSDF